MPPEEPCVGADDELRPEALPRATRVHALINRINAYEAEGAEIKAEMQAVGLDAKQVKKIQDTQRTLAALMGSDLLPEGAKL